MEFGGSCLPCANEWISERASGPPARLKEVFAKRYNEQVLLLSWATGRKPEGVRVMGFVSRLRFLLSSFFSWEVGSSHVNCR